MLVMRRFKTTSIQVWSHSDSESSDCSLHNRINWNVLDTYRSSGISSILWVSAIFFIVFLLFLVGFSANVNNSKCTTFFSGRNMLLRVLDQCIKHVFFFQAQICCRGAKLIFFCVFSHYRLRMNMANKLDLFLVQNRSWYGLPTKHHQSGQIKQFVIKLYTYISFTDLISIHCTTV